MDESIGTEAKLHARILAKGGSQQVSDMILDIILAYENNRGPEAKLGLADFNMFLKNAVRKLCDSINAQPESYYHRLMQGARDGTLNTLLPHLRRRI